MENENKKRNTRKPGRKPKKDPAVFRYSLRLNSHENVIFERLFDESELKDKSAFIKAAIFGNKIKVVKIDKATMDYYTRLTNFYHQFQAIGNNYNQTIRAIKTNFGDKRAMTLLYKLEKATIQLVIISKEIMRLTEEFELKWLQK